MSVDTWYVFFFFGSDPVYLIALVDVTHQEIPSIGEPPGSRIALMPVGCNPRTKGSGSLGDANYKFVSLLDLLIISIPTNPPSW